jgi:hypothetical protein
MRIRITPIMLLLCLTIADQLQTRTSASLQAGESTQQNSSKVKVVLEGILVKANGAPVVGRDVFAFAIKDGKVVVFPAFDGGRLLDRVDTEAHAKARTDVKGHFRIRYGGPTGVEVTYVGDGFLVQGDYEGFTVGVLRKDGTAAFLKSQSGDQTAATWRKEADTILIQFGKVVIPN